MSGDPLDVSGAWDGIFSYPHSMPPNAFRATLAEHGGAIGGEVEERRDDEPAQGAVLHAILTGQRDGQTVDFTKHYDALDRAPYPVQYAGTLNPDGTEISGRWSIPGVWSGTFLMIRARPPGVAAEQVVAETVR